MPRWTKYTLRVAVSLTLLVVVGRFLDWQEVGEGIRGMSLGWVALALVVSVLQVAVSAWRWRLTSVALGLELHFGDALREYYLASFLNQVLPGGVLGDVSRAWRQGRTQGPEGPRRGVAIRAVVIERASGQLVMGGAALASVMLVPSLPAGWRIGAGLVGVLGLLALGHAMRSASRAGGEGLWGEIERSLLGRSILPAQLGSSLVVVASYVLVFLIGARALGVEASSFELAPLVAPLLMTMLVPVTIAGWGLREGAAALLWSAVGLSAVDGVTASVGYGLLVLVSTLPGAVVLLLPRPD